MPNIRRSIASLFWRTKAWPAIKLSDRQTSGQQKNVRIYFAVSVIVILIPVNYIFLINNFKLAARTIADIYKARRQEELFFKWIKQNLKIKSFIGTSKNAVMIQIGIAICVYLLLAFIKFQSKMNKTMQQILRLLELNLFEKRDLMTLLRGDPPNLNHTSDFQMTLLWKLMGQ